MQVLKRLTRALAAAQLAFLNSGDPTGYVYDPKRNYIGTTYPHLRPAFKDGFYEHPCDSFLYGSFPSP